MTPSAASAGRSHLARRAGIASAVFGVLAVLAVVFYYVFVVSAGRPGAWPTWSVFYDTQAEGFRSGHLYAAVPGPPGVRHWDYSLYQGHSYLYWGLLPALLLAGVKAALRLGTAVGDEVLVFVALVVRALAAAVLVRRLALRAVPRPGPVLVGLGFLVLVLGNPIPFLLARAAIYEASIAAGAAFVMLAVAAAVEALFADDDRRATRWITAASAALALGAASRVSLWPTAALLTAFLVAAEARRRPGPGVGRRFVAIGLRVCAPFVVVLAACLLVNRLRFGAWTEFGGNYQNGFVFKMGARFLPLNTFLYLFHLPTFTCRFPFLLAPWETPQALTPSLLPSLFSWPADYRVEPLVGILAGVPFVALALVPLAAFVRRRGGAGAPRDPWRLLTAFLSLGAVPSLLPLLLLFSASMRHETDLLAFLLPLAILGGWQLVGRQSRPGPRRAAMGLTVATALASIALGVALGFTGYFTHFDRHNPALMKRLRDKLSLCAPAPGRP